VYKADYQRAFIAPWDGSAWTSCAWPSWQLRERQRNQPHQMVAGSDGTIWFTEALTSFDGQSWRRYAVPGRARSEWPRVMDLAVSPEGITWIVVRDLIKFGTSRPDGIYVIDPIEAQPSMTEAARLIEATASSQTDPDPSTTATP
jgi:hypothetical protein